MLRIAWDAFYAAIAASFDPSKPLFSRLRSKQRQPEDEMKNR